MWSNKEVKSLTRKNLKFNYWACIFACFFMAFFSIEYSISNTILGSTTDDYGGGLLTSIQDNKANLTGSEVAGKAISFSTGFIDNEKLQEATSGVLATIANNATQISATLTFIAGAVRQALTDRPIASFLISLLGAAASIAFFMFFKAQLIVGERRFYLENRLYHDTRATRVFCMYSMKNVWNVAKIMLLRQVLIYLWFLTIVFGVIRIYEYRAIPYILAENPSMGCKECFALSKKMAYGHKMEMFKFDLSYIHWVVLAFVSLGLIPLFFSNSYYRGAQSEIHAILRENAKAESMEYSDMLSDRDLFIHSDEELAADVYPTVKIRDKFELAIPWNRKYNIIHIALIFFAFAMIGWCWEVFYHFIKDGDLVNRGSLYGPWLPIYGVGGALVVILLKPLGKKPAVLALFTFIACGVVEYFTAWYFETFKNIKYWDYSHFLFNLDGRICLEGLIMFTVLASLGLYVIAPRLDELFKKWPMSVKIPLLCVLTAGFVGDLLYTHDNPHTGDGISSDI